MPTLIARKAGQNPRLALILLHEFVHSQPRLWSNFSNTCENDSAEKCSPYSDHISEAGVVNLMMACTASWYLVTISCKKFIC